MTIHTFKKRMCGLTQTTHENSQGIGRFPREHQSAWQASVGAISFKMASRPKGYPLSLTTLSAHCWARGYAPTKRNPSINNVRRRKRARDGNHNYSFKDFMSLLNE
ncbi:hypothetical protein RUM43_003263 [Polyplax serrata]|uniref:Uncharacterized protein n=1 Tax=Polyplax serrata TaxID=468196 RepID=A0AAN8P1W4_POLSC